MQETIAAISTPFGRGGIGIIRLSGDQALDIADRVFKGKKPVAQMKTHTINYGKVIDPESCEVIDEALLSVMKAPNTFTRENVAEINCHGGTVVLMRIMDLVLREGAVPAQPGEFTRRAFMNGRLDLSQAEAVIDIINAKTSESSRAAVEQLEGSISARIREVRGKLIELIAHIDVTVDYPEHDIEDVTGSEVYDTVKIITAQLQDILKGFERGRIIREGISAVIAGKPNVGKSSLLNELSGKNRAIVTDIPGTTRDIIEEYIDIKGIPVRIIDTAGIRQTEDMVERIGVEKAEKAITMADLIIVMFDAATELDAEDIGIIEKTSGRKTLYVINKIDIVDKKSADEKNVDNSGAEFLENRLLEICGKKSTGDIHIIKVSVKNREGIDSMGDAIYDMFSEGGAESSNEILLTNIRHKQLMASAASCLDDAVVAYENSIPLDFITIDLRNAADFLGQITGESVSEDVIQEIFSRFCVGK